MSEDTITAGAPNRTAIERWENDGGRALALEESVSARMSDFPRSDPGDGISLGVGSQAWAARMTSTDRS